MQKPQNRASNWYLTSRYACQTDSAFSPTSNQIDFHGAEDIEVHITKTRCSMSLLARADEGHHESEAATVPIAAEHKASSSKYLLVLETAAALLVPSE